MEQTLEQTTDMQALIEDAGNYWNSLQTFRDNTARARRFYTGDQWSDKVKDDDGNMITEKKQIENSGRYPYVINITGQIVGNLLGRFRIGVGTSMVIARTREEQSQSEMLSNALQACRLLNRAEAIEARNYESFAVSGLAVTKTVFEYFPEIDRSDGKYKNVNVNRFFFNTDAEDVRMNDITMLGEIHDMPFNYVVSSYAESPEDEKRLGVIYSQDKEPTVNMEAFDAESGIDNMAFLTPLNPDKCRVIEIWKQEPRWKLWVHDELNGEAFITDEKREVIDAENNKRIIAAQEAGEIPKLLYAEDKNEPVWVVRHLSPDGDILFEADNIYQHGSHPYTVTPYPYLDQEIKSFVTNLIPNQKQVNRNFGLIDSVIGSSSKGLLVVYEALVADDQKNKIQEIWSSVRGVLRLKHKAGIPEPKQLTSNPPISALQSMLQMNIGLMDKISGTGSAIQGQAPTSGTSGKLYAQQTENSTINSKDFESVYREHREQADKKMLKIIQQFYTDKRFVQIAGKDATAVAAVYDPEAVRNFDFDYVIKESQSPLIRAESEQGLDMLFAAKELTINEYAELSGKPFSDKLLELLRRREEKGTQSPAQEEFGLRKQEMASRGVGV